MVIGYSSGRAGSNEKQTEIASINRLKASVYPDIRGTACPKPTPDELYHYTGIQGLKGIIESQTLWATHYKFLNDAEEVVHFQQRLPRILTPVFTSLIKDFHKEGRQALIDKYGTIEKALEEEPKTLARVMFEVTFANRDGDGAFAEPFISAFCTVNKNNERVANDGLLSQ